MARLTDRPPAPPPRAPLRMPAPRPPLSPADPKLRQRAAAAFALGLLSLIPLLLIGNVQRGAAVAWVTLAVAVTALVLAIPLLSAAKRAGSRRPRAAVPAVVLGVLGLLASAVALIVFTAFPTQIEQYVNCMNQAAGSTAQQACQTQLMNSIDAKLGAQSNG